MSMTATITNIKWEDGSPAELPTSYELELDADYINELVDDSENELDAQSVAETVIYEDLPSLCAIEDIEYNIVSFDFVLE